MATNRIDNFNKLKNHPWLGRSFKKLTKDDIEFAISFLKENENNNDDIFCHKAVRLFIDKTQKPKAWKEIEELLIASRL